MTNRLIQIHEWLMREARSSCPGGTQEQIQQSYNRKACERIRHLEKALEAKGSEADEVDSILDYLKGMKS